MMENVGEANLEVREDLSGNDSGLSGFDEVGLVNSRSYPVTESGTGAGAGELSHVLWAWINPRQRAPAALAAYVENTGDEQIECGLELVGFVRVAEKL